MSPKISEQIQAEQNHGRSKYGSGPDDTAHDDAHEPEDWIDYLYEHLERVAFGTPMEYRQELVKVAGLAVSAIEAFDRKNPKPKD